MTVVRKTITVEAPAAIAFRVFTDSMDRWWPRSGHHISPAGLKQAVLEGREGGRWYEVDINGTECDWGRVLEWDPPTRLVLAWQIDATWHYNPHLVTEVEIQFVAEGPDRTRVELEHRNLERFGDAMENIRAGLDLGWHNLLAAFAQATVA